MSQATLTSYFNVRKQSDDQHATKKRKVVTPEGVAAKSTGVPVVDAPEMTPKGVESESKNGRRRKRETMEESDKVLFTVGSGKARRRLKMEEKNVAFLKAGNLSPTKGKISTQKQKCPPKAEKFDPLSAKVALNFDFNEAAKKTEPELKLNSVLKAKVALNFDLDETSKKTESEPEQKMVANANSPSKVMEKLNQLTAQEVKAKIKKVNKLSDLQAQLRSLRKDKNLGPKRALFNDKPEEVKAAPKPPQMSPKKVLQSVATDATKPVITSPKKGPKASPRKAIPAFVRYQELAQPDKYLPLPNRYKALAEIFRNVDMIVGMKFNRQEMIRVPDLKPAVQNLTRKSFSEFYLRQIRCVFPNAYKYVWEKVLDRLGRHTGDFELHMSPDHGVKATLSPQIKVERLKMFQNALLNIVQDNHREFLAKIGIIGIKDELVTKWHKNFDLDQVPDIDEAELPPKPDVEKVRNPKEMLENLAGVNDRLANSLKKIQAAAAVVAEPVEAPKIRKELRGLKPELIQKILANEKAKQIKDMTQSSDERKDLEQLKELITLAPVIINCHRSHRKGAVLSIERLAQVTADSCGRKSKQAMLELIKLFLKVVPECMELKTIERVQYIKLKKTSPDVNEVKKILEKLVAQK